MEWIWFVKKKKRLYIILNLNKSVDVCMILVEMLDYVIGYWNVYFFWNINYVVYFENKM